MSRELSPAAAARLNELRAMELPLAFASCLHNEGGEASPEIRLERLLERQAGELEPIYFADTTERTTDKLLERAEKHLVEGAITERYAFVFETPFPWGSFEHLSRSLRFKLQAWWPMETMLRASELAQHQPSLERVNSLALDWVRHFIFEKNEDDFGWYDMAVGQRASKIAYLAQHALRRGRGEDLMRYVVAAQIHLLELLCPERFAGHSNHGLFQMAGLLGIASTMPYLTHATEAKRLATSQIRKMLREHFATDGLHKEHSPDYHVFMVNYLVELARTGWMDKSKAFARLLDTAKEATRWLTQPDGHVLPFGDSKNVPIASRAMYPLALGPKGHPQPPEGFKVFDEGGVVVVSAHDEAGQASEYLAFGAQFHSRQHKHSDNFGIQLCHRGRQILVDTGTFTYQYDAPERLYAESTRAHNTVSIDSHNTARFRAAAYGSAISYAVDVGGCFVMEAEMLFRSLLPLGIPWNQEKSALRIRSRVTHRRTIAYRPGSFLLLLDLMQSPEPHAYTSWLHLAPELELAQQNQHYLCSRDEETVACFSVLSPEAAHAELIRGQKEPILQGWTSLDGRTLEPSFALGFTAQGATVLLATLLTFGPEPPPTSFSATPQGEGVQLRLATHKAQELLLHRPAGQLTIGFRHGSETSQKQLAAQ